MLLVRVQNLFCSFQKSTGLLLGIGPLLMLHLACFMELAAINYKNK